MTETSKLLSIIAYYFSEYDMRAVTALGYKNRTQAFKDISVKMNHDNNYLKLRRDEFDALPGSLSHRAGWINRPAASDVIDMAEYLKNYSFDDMTKMVIALISNQSQSQTVENNDVIDYPADNFSETELEQIINYTDPSATIKIKLSENKSRVYDTSIIAKLKKLYNGTCQICGHIPFEKFHTDICEAHHVDYFANSYNNNANNILILCPNHHRLIHKLNPFFDRKDLKFTYPDGSAEKLIINKHLG